MKTLRETLDASGRHLGLTFTAPSSYWYLRWFDLRGLIKYADWINLMSVSRIQNVHLSMADALDHAV